MAVASRYGWDAARAVVLAALLCWGVTSLGSAPSAVQPPADRYDVVIAGGSTAALGAAFAAADEGASVALLEPTDWIGGQLTSSGVPAVDEAWHKVRAPVDGQEADPHGGEGRILLDVARVARDPRNMTPFFRDALAEIGNPGAGWVSRYCFEPLRLLDGYLRPRERALADRLTIYRETVVKRIETDGRRVTAIEAIRRTPRDGVDPYGRVPSQDLADWYSPEDSPRFTKETLRFAGAVFVDATEWGEVLALADAPWLQGVERQDWETAADGDDARSLTADDTLGQSTVFCFVQRLHDAPVTGHPSPAETGADRVEGLGYGPYADREDAWGRIWTYRRLLGSGPDASPGELSLQNWGYDTGRSEGGNDYPFAYLFLSSEETAAQRADWRGGVDAAAMAAAERRAFAWHDWFRQAAPEPLDPDQITLAGDVFGTTHGLAKLPYIRDTRRSIGVGGFLLRFSDLIGEATADGLSRLTGTPFPDTVALGAYAADIHPLVGYEYPPHVFENHPTLPFCLPLRALTNDGYDNLMVAGKTMAQTFLANSATRLHPIEWSTGTACGVVAADLARSGATTTEACKEADRLRDRIARYTPVDWTIPAEAVGAEPRAAAGE